MNGFHWTNYRESHRNYPKLALVVIQCDFSFRIAVSYDKFRYIFSHQSLHYESYRNFYKLEIRRAKPNDDNNNQHRNFGAVLRYQAEVFIA